MKIDGMTNFDLLGALVESLVDEVFEAGETDTIGKNSTLAFLHECIDKTYKGTWDKKAKENK